MTPFAQARQRRREHEVPPLSQKRHDFLPEPGAVPGRVNQDEDFRFHTLRRRGMLIIATTPAPYPAARSSVST